MQYTQRNNEALFIQAGKVSFRERLTHVITTLTMHIQQKFRRQQISEVLVIVAMVLLLIYIADGVYQYFSHPPGIGQGKQGFLPINAAQRGMIFGASSIILFFLSFGIGIKEKLLNHRLHVVHIPHRWYALEEKEHGVNQLRVIGGVYDCCLRTGMHFYNDYCGFTSLHPVLLQQVEGKMGYSEILEMVDHIKRFLMVLSFNKNKWLQCTLCQKH